jgi:hypothetical protein
MARGHVAPSGAQPDAATLTQGLNQAQAIYYRHLARLHGMNPDDPNALALIGAAAKDPALRAKLFARTQQVTPPPASGGTPPDHGITTVAPPILKDEGTGSAATSSETQTVEDPHLKAVGAHITQMLNSNVSDDQIRAFAQANAPTANVNEELTFRHNNPGSVGNFTVSPEFYRKQVPLTGVRKAIASADKVPYAGPALVGAADTATMGASPDIAGVIHGVTGAGPTREDVITARNASAAKTPALRLSVTLWALFSRHSVVAGGLGRTALNSAAYGFFGSEDPSLAVPLVNAGISRHHWRGSARRDRLCTNSVRPVYRAGRQAVLTPIIGPEAAATDAALNRAATQMPAQDMKARLPSTRLCLPTALTRLPLRCLTVQGRTSWVSLHLVAQRRAEFLSKPLAITARRYRPPLLMTSIRLLWMLRQIIPIQAGSLTSRCEKLPAMFRIWLGASTKPA